MVYRIEIERRAYKELKQMPDKEAIRILEEVVSLSIDPHKGKVLKGKLLTLYSLRIRIGNYRVLYHLNEKTKVVRIARIGHRREVYRDLERLN